MYKSGNLVLKFCFIFNQIMTKSMSSSTENELEARVKTLTESLIQKQTTLETLSTQKNSLALQLERLEVRIVHRLKCYMNFPLIEEFYMN